ncbi:hypothetical protein PVAND_002083 [Polypedilum vanderplanki]|uniref:Amine oxidase n=1 Tax=Polypedilum vanderplanki TaxID=319348 RepID=A0A9J6BQ77_POLVA|nr:hypothetical protein PVAND_002083 [Polypedilum vanderplanki]
MWIKCLFLSILFINALDAEKSVIIVGAGLSGFSAAAKLMEKGGYDITILEAEGQIGGRIKSISYQDGSIDMGAQWIHGEVDNIIYQTAKNFGFGKTNFDTIDQTFVRSDGAALDQNLLNKLSKMIYEIVEHSDSEMRSYNGPFGNFVWEKFLKELNEDEILVNTDPKLIELFKNHIERELIGHHASNSWNDVSAVLNSNFADASGFQHWNWKKAGFFTYFNYITKNGGLNIKSKTQLNKKVTNIKYDLSSPTEKVIVRTADGKNYSAEHVIFTGSLGVLKKFHSILFIPNLPQDKITAIEKNAFGAIAKVFLHFEQPFWPNEDFISYSFLWNDAQRDEAKANGREWLFGVAAFFIVDQYPNLLEGFIGGEKVKDFENTNDEKLIDDIMWFFEKFLGKTIPKPTIAGRTKWLTNENFLGTYTYLSMEAEKAKVGPDDLEKSLYNSDDKPVILFAGEATDFNYPSFAHGAITSGNRAADVLIKYYDSLN